MDLHPFEILRKPVITEKSTDLQDDGRYVFEVAKTATKHQIKWAVQEAFGVTVTKVNTMNKKGKTKRYGPRISQKKAVKRAIVTLAPGESITIFEGV